MAYSHTPAKRAPISRHPAFVPLCSVWLAALLSGCIAVLPHSLVIANVSQFAIPAIVTSQMLLTAIAGVAGGLVGWIAARAIASAQSDNRVEPVSHDTNVIEEEAAVCSTDFEEDAKPIETALPVAEVEPELQTPPQEELITEVIPAPADPIAEVDEENEETPRHGKVVNLLRGHATDELAMPQLIERFAVALDDHRSEESGAAHSYSPPAPPDEMAEHLRALLRQPRPSN